MGTRVLEKEQSVTGSDLTAAHLLIHFLLWEQRGESNVH